MSDMESPFVETWARLLFDAYNNAGPSPGKTWDGKPVPPWESLGEQVQGKWKAAARAAIKEAESWL